MGTLIIAGVLLAFVIKDFLHIATIPIFTAAPVTWCGSFIMTTLTVEAFCPRVRRNFCCFIEAVEIQFLIFDPALWALA